jgi:putative acyl-CoA dehydrogenase
MATLPLARAANQPPPLADHDLFAGNRPLAEALERQGAGWAAERCSALWTVLTGEPLEWGRLANENVPQLRTHDRFGERIDEVEFHPAWHALMRSPSGTGSTPCRDRAARRCARRPGGALHLTAQVGGATAARLITHAAVPALRAAAPELAAQWEPLLTSSEYDFGLRPAAEKHGALCGMAMTERQGGSDVRANTTAARPLGDGEYLLDGQKWFCSAPMSDAFLASQAPPVSPALCSRACSDATRNGFRIEV